MRLSWNDGTLEGKGDMVLCLGMLTLRINKGNM